MKKHFTLFWVMMLVLFFYGINSLAQDGSAVDDRIWSIVKVVPVGPGQIDPNFKYDDTPGQTKYYEFESGGVTVLPAARVLPTTNTTQSELSIAVHPGNSNIVFGSSNATNWPVTTLFGTGVYWSLDGALSWTGFDVPPFGSNSGDPVSQIGLDGRFYENYISNPGGMGLSVSTNNGANWTNHTIAPNPGSLADKNHYNVDKTSSSPFVNRSYCTWTDFGGANNNHAVLRWSSNFGVGWSSSINLSNTLSPGSHAQGVNVQNALNGDVYVTFAIYDNFPTGEDAIGFAKSTDGGVTWTRNRVYGALTPNGGFNFGIRGNLASKNNIRVSSFPVMGVDRSGGPNTGNIYICWAQRTVAPAGNDPDVVMIRSTNGGTTWSAPIRVNDDPINNGKDQYFPWLAVDQLTGRVLMVWYDSRDVPNNQAEVFMGHSVDGGLTFENFKVSSAPHSPAPIPGLAGGYAGDYIGLDGLDDIAYPFWAQNSTGNYQAWFAEAQFSAPCPVTGPTNPNPANGTGNLPLTGNSISWTNGAGTTLNEIYFNGNLVYDGAAVTSRTLAQLGVEPLSYLTSYTWRIVCKDAACGTTGPNWTFTTMDNPGLVIDTLFCEAFEGGLGGWTITNDGGTPGCIWQIRFAPFPNTYTLPPASSGGIMTADSDECGNPSTLLSTAALNQPFNLSIYTTVWIEFDNDWNILDAQDEAHVEVSTNGGSTWVGVWDQIGTDIRNTHELVDITAIAAGQSDVRFRLRSVQPGWDWWWVLDNFCIYGEYVIPVELTSFNAYVTEDNVTLNWVTATEINNQGFEVQRKIAGSEFEKIGYVPGFGTSTETKSYSYTDSKVKAGTYTYRLKQMDFDGTFEYSPEIETEISAPAEYALEQNYPNPFNPSTTIKYSIAEDGFVKLSVYNLLGEEVSTLVNNMQKAGRYDIQFNASDLSSGVYIYRIESTNFTASRKLLLMK